MDGAAETAEDTAGGPSRPFILRPVATTLMMVAMLLAGLIACFNLPLSALPEVDYPTIQVTTLYPGGSPEVMALTVTAPLERQFGQMPGLARMISSSSSGASVVTLQFNLDLDLDVAEQEVQAAINAASTLLPTDLPAPPVYAKVNPADAPILSLAITSPARTLGEVEAIVERQFANRIGQVSGVGLVSVSGGQRPAVRIQANMAALASRGLSLESIRTAIGNANVNAAKGSFDGPSKSWTIDANDQLASADQYAVLVVAYQNGAAVRLRDVANVVSSTENTRLRSWMNREPAIILDVQRQPGANVIATVDAIRQALPGLEAQLPADVHVTLLSDRTEGIRASVSDVCFELVVAVLLVTLAIFMFLGSWRATLIASIAVPLSLLGAFAPMWAMGFSINNLTLMALTIASGFVVDDAIVVLENISRHVENGMRPFQAALKGAGEIGFTIVSLTVSLIAVLIPLLFMGDIVGRLFREFAVSLAATILLSAVVALTLVPMLAARWLRPAQQERPSRISQWTVQRFEQLTALYARGLDWVIVHARLTLLAFVATLGLTALLFAVVPRNLFPEQDTGQIAATTLATQDLSFAAMSELQQQVANALLADPAVASLSSSIGVDGQNPALKQGRLSINLVPIGQRSNLDEVVSRLRQRTDGIIGVRLFLQPVQDLVIDTEPGITGYRLVLQGADQTLVDQWGQRLAQALAERDELRDVTPASLGEGSSVIVDIDRDAAARLGANALAVDNALYDAFGQRIVSTIYTASSQNRVILEASPDLLTGPQGLQHLYVPAGNTVVPLTALATIRNGTAPLVIAHEAQFPAASIGFNLAPGVSLGTAMRAIARVQQDIALPAALNTCYSGAAGAFQDSLGNEMLLILAAVVVVYIVLGVLYESFVHPLTILSTLPSAGVGALLALGLSGWGLGVIGIIGIVLLIGIVKKNAIMMIDYALMAMREEGKDAVAAIRQAALLRFRPIMMTTFAALFAALPLIFGSGMGHELRQPLGIAIAGGLILSQALTLFTTPVIFLMFERLRERHARPAAATGEPG
ncbi:RND transporter, HAE1/HME family, permease protein [Stenotrophomonas sp. SKA14]|uniref:efflux RND transporter permease subunit n=1 Tax=Stenotrophomonas TaxID=40323 RepID=UPI00018FEB85|nr:efflux RND transporter permease subunit [Stenotrophomonas sp. SKA14]EED40082.1 RND transporter, HAE1/HME family, permease protein [Stenotrophomonas sp. SKA14]